MRTSADGQLSNQPELLPARVIHGNGGGRVRSRILFDHQGWSDKGAWISRNAALKIENDFMIVSADTLP
jgi:hypothetical protein